MNINIFENHTIFPFAKLGLIGSFWGLNISTIIYTWIVIAILLLFGFLIKVCINNKNKLYFILPANEFIGFFEENINNNLGDINERLLGFVLPMFLFVFMSNIIGLLPFVEEPTADVNTCLAIGVYCFCFVQIMGIRAKGLKYFNKYFSPVFLLFPLNLIGQVSKIISMSFRLFGNILAGSIILNLLKSVIISYSRWYVCLNLFALIIIMLNNSFKLSIKNMFFSYLTNVCCMFFYFIPVIQIFFGFFEGTVQALIVALLTVMYVGNELSKESGH